MKSNIVALIIIASLGFGCASSEKDYEALRDKRHPLWEQKLTESNAESLASLKPYDITQAEAAEYFVRASIAEDQLGKVKRTREQKERYSQAQVDLAAEALRIQYGRSFGVAEDRQPND